MCLLATIAQRPCYGYELVQQLARQGLDLVSEGSIYPLLSRLQQHGYIEGYLVASRDGPHPAAFAEAWAREMRPRVLRGGARVLRGLVYALSVVSSSALLSQLLAHAPAFTFTLFAAYMLAGSGLLALLLQLGGFLAPRISARAGREALMLAGVVLAVLVLR